MSGLVGLNLLYVVYRQCLSKREARLHSRPSFRDDFVLNQRSEPWPDSIHIEIGDLLLFCHTVWFVCDRRPLHFVRVFLLEGGERLKTVTT